MRVDKEQLSFLASRLYVSIIGSIVFVFVPVQAIAQAVAKPATPNVSPASQPQAALPPWPELKIPNTNSVQDLAKFVTEAKTLQPTTPERYRDMQNAIMGASKRIVELTKDRNTDAYRTAEFDYFSSSVMLLGNEGPDAQRKTYERFRDYIKNKPTPTENDMRMVLMTGQNLEQIPDGKLAREAYNEFSKILKAKKSDAFKVWIEIMDANARRVELPGKEMVVTGKTIVGDDFDIKSCRGKFTLVYFWASWDTAFKQEYPYMRKVYLEYRDKGFEIVAVSVDEDREKLENVVRENEIPWINLWDEENRTSPVAVQQYGISAIPTMILLDRQGKVVSMEARGLLLGKLLAKYIDNAETAAVQQPNQKQPAQ